MASRCHGRTRHWQDHHRTGVAPQRPANGHQWLAAPTGRAAQRLSEATGSEAKTLHRLLEFNPRTNDFNRNASNPLDAEGVLIDESRTVDLRLMAALVAACPTAAGWCWSEAQTNCPV